MDFFLGFLISCFDRIPYVCVAVQRFPFIFSSGFLLSGPGFLLAACIFSHGEYMDLPAGFSMDFVSSRADLYKVLEQRWEKPSQQNLDLWLNAWDRFRVESFQHISPQKCLKVSDPTSLSKVESAHMEYRHQAVLHFLPHFTNLLPLVSGKRELVVREAISILELWKSCLPLGARTKLDLPSFSISLVVPIPAKNSIPPKQYREPGPQQPGTEEKFDDESSDDSIIDPHTIYIPKDEHLEGVPFVRKIFYQPDNL